MADERGQGLDVLLKQFGREAESLVSSAGPAAARARGEQRRSRRRTTAASVVSAAVLTTVAWGWLPGLISAPDDPGPRPAYAAAASVLPSPDTDGRLTPASLLAPTALPRHQAYQWHVSAIGHGKEVPSPEVCHHPKRPLGGPHRAEVAATYSGRDGASAQHRILQYGTRAQAVERFASLEQALRACGWHETRPVTPSHSPAPNAKIEYSRTAQEGHTRIAVVRRENRLAILLVSTGPHADGRH